MAIKTVEVFRKIRDEHYRILNGKSYEERFKFDRRKSRFLHIKVSRLLKNKLLRCD